MAKPNKIKKGTPLYKRTRKRAKAQGEWKDIREGGVTRKEARSVKPKGAGGKGGKAGPGIRGRAEERLDYLESHGGLDGLEGIRKKGITRPEARRVRKAWRTEKAMDPLTPRSGRGIQRTSTRLADLEYAPLEADVREQRLNTQGRENVLYGPGGWMEGYRADVAASAQRQQAAELAFQAGLGAQAQASASAFSGQQHQMGATAPGQQAGGGVSPDVAAQAQIAEQGRMAMAQQSAAALAQRGAANVGAVNSMAIAAAQQAQEGLMNSQARMQRIDRLASDLAREKGLARTKHATSLTEQERSYSLGRGALGLDVAQAQEDTRHNKATERENRKARKAAQREKNRQYRLDVKELGRKRANDRWDKMEGDRQYQLDVDEFGEKKAQNRWDREHPSGSGKGDLTAGQKDDYQEALALLRAGASKGKLPKSKTEAINRLTQKGGIGGVAARRAVNRYWKKHKVGRAISNAGGGNGDWDLGL